MRRGGIDPLEFRFHAMTDRVATTGATWLGLTLGCAQCHTHKYDPITHSEYYAFMALLDNADEPAMELPDPKRDADYREALKQADQEVAALVDRWIGSEQERSEPGEAAQEPAAARADFGTWIAHLRTRLGRWQALEPRTATSNMPLLTILDDRSILASGDITKRDTYEVTFDPGQVRITAIRLEALPHDSLPGRGPGMTYYEGQKGDFFVARFQLTADGKPVAIRRATDSYRANQYGGDQRPVAASLTIDDDFHTGWSIHGGEGQRHEAVYELETPLTDIGELGVRIECGRHYACSLGRFRIAATADPLPVEASPLPVDLQDVALRAEKDWTETDRRKLLGAFVLEQPEFAEERQKIQQLRKRPAYDTALVMRERPAENPRRTFRRRRGEYLQPLEEVAPATPAVLHPLVADGSPDRLALARWLVSPHNPLTARVVVNRHWAAFFGRGIVETVDDFGVQGAPPTHPKLLDWLAVEFMRQGWSMKALHRSIVTSAAYRQSSQVKPRDLASDPDNYWLMRAPRPRLEAEVIRDSILRASGLLSEKQGAPASIRRSQPA